MFLCPSKFLTVNQKSYISQGSLILFPNVRVIMVSYSIFTMVECSLVKLGRKIIDIRILEMFIFRPRSQHGNSSVKSIFILVFGYLTMTVTKTIFN